MAKKCPKQLAPSNAYSSSESLSLPSEPLGRFKSPESLNVYLKVWLGLRFSGSRARFATSSHQPSISLAPSDLRVIVPTKLERDLTFLLIFLGLVLGFDLTSSDFAGAPSAAPAAAASVGSGFTEPPSAFSASASAATGSASASASASGSTSATSLALGSSVDCCGLDGGEGSLGFANLGDGAAGGGDGGGEGGTALGVTVAAVLLPSGDLG
mmetsp:Transcript_51584/g.117414  ORF Transcript_51584/g.117414 Transcript_51584/m.117414 type:complete len:212 (+) Transcript_51584:576-1211(+)